MEAAFKQVFGNVRYAALAGIVAAVVFILLLSLPNFGTIVDVVSFPAGTLFEKMRVVTGLLASVISYASSLSSFSLVATAALFGGNVSAAVYYARRVRAFPRAQETALGTSGLLGGFLGAGCVACGSIVLNPFFAFLGAGTVASFLPFGGSELGLLGVGALALSLALFLKRIGAKNVC